MNAHAIRQAGAAIVLAGITLGATALPAGAAVAHRSQAVVTETGHLSKVDSKSTFTLVVGMKKYVVKLDAMTHIKDAAKVIKFSALKAGETVQVKGPLEMGQIEATSVVVEM